MLTRYVIPTLLVCQANVQTHAAQRTVAPMPTAQLLIMKRSAHARLCLKEIQMLNANQLSVKKTGIACQIEHVTQVFLDVSTLVMFTHVGMVFVML